MADVNKGLFDNLADLGFGGLEEVSLFKDEEKKEEIKKSVQTSPADFVFDRKVICPVCSSQITVKAVKTSGVRILSKDTDFMTYYQEPNPMFYDAWLCTNCGYAALSNKFNSLLDKQRQLIKDNISMRWKKKVYPDTLYNVDVAIEMHQMALLNAVVKNARDSEKAMICLKIGWLFRLKKDDQSEAKFISQAVQGFAKAFEKEALPIAGMDGPTVQYLVGELYRRAEDNRSALLWFSRVLSDRSTKPKIKEMARDQKDIIQKLMSQTDDII